MKALVLAFLLAAVVSPALADKGGPSDHRDHSDRNVTRHAEPDYSVGNRWYHWNHWKHWKHWRHHR